MTISPDRSLDQMENPCASRARPARPDRYVRAVGVALLGVIIAAGAIELAWRGDPMVVVLRTALLLIAGGAAVWLFSREIARMREGQARNSLVMAASDAGIWDWNVLTGEMFLSERAQQLYGIEPGATTHSRTQWRRMIKFHPDDVDAQQSAVEDYLTGPAPTYDGEWRAGQMALITGWGSGASACGMRRDGRCG